MRTYARLGWLIFLAGCGDGGEGGGTGGSSAPGDASAALFDDHAFTDFHLTMSVSDWNSIINDTMGDTWRRCTLRWKDQTLDDVAVRPAGNSTRYPGNPKMSLRLDFNEFVPKRKFMGLHSVKLDGLRERTMMRDRLSYEVFRSRMAAPRAVHCRLFVNEEYRGVYMVEERVTGTFVQQRFGHEEGNLYRILVGKVEAFGWQGSSLSFYVPAPWEPHTNELVSDHREVLGFLDVLNNRPSELDTVLDLQNLTDYLAVEAAIIAYDGILRDQRRPPHNVYMYSRPDNGRFEMIPWDVDQTWTALQTSRDLFANFDNTRLAAVVRDTPALNDLYRRNLAEIISSATQPDRIAARVDFFYAQIKDAVHADPYKVATNDQFDSYPALLKSISRDRYASLKAQLGQ